MGELLFKMCNPHCYKYDRLPPPVTPNKISGRKINEWKPSSVLKALSSTLETIKPLKMQMTCSSPTFIHLRRWVHLILPKRPLSRLRGPARSALLGLLLSAIWIFHQHLFLSGGGLCCLRGSHSRAQSTPLQEKCPHRVPMHILGLIRTP